MTISISFIVIFAKSCKYVITYDQANTIKCKPILSALEEYFIAFCATIGIATIFYLSF